MSSGGQRRRRLGAALVGLVLLAAAAAAASKRLARARQHALTGAGRPLDPDGGTVGAERAVNARVLGPAGEPAALAALARWQPSPPRGALGRLLAYAWAAPITVAGLLAGATSGVRPRVEQGVLLFPNARGLAGAVLRRRGFAAGALGHVVISAGEPSAALFAHELVHVRQAERLGPLLAPVYLGLLAVYGYARHPMERAARRGGRS